MRNFPPCHRTASSCFRFFEKKLLLQKIILSFHFTKRVSSISGKAVKISEITVALLLRSLTFPMDATVLLTLTSKMLNLRDHWFLYCTPAAALLCIFFFLFLPCRKTREGLSCRGSLKHRRLKVGGLIY